MSRKLQLFVEKSFTPLNIFIYMPEYAAGHSFATVKLRICVVSVPLDQVS